MPNVRLYGRPALPFSDEARAAFGGRVGVEGSDEEAGMGRMTTGICKRWAALLAMVMVAPLLALASGPAVAVDGKADNLPSYTACLGEAADSAGFVDTLGHFAEGAIDCMAYYGITLGTTPERFSPNQPIIRWQMALFLVRAAGPAGIDLPEPSDQGFEDLDRMAPFIRDAINQVAALRITRGTSPTTFSPTLHMDRRSMALFIYRFLSMARPGPGGADATLIIPDDTVFVDLSGQSEDTVTAVRVLYEMGVTTGTTATTFSPNRRVTRAQMALFFTRALAHTNARPVGVTIQSDAGLVSAGDTLDVNISMRNKGFRPRVGSLVDVFSTPADDPYSSFGPDGACLPGVEVAFGARVCMIDRSDQRLDESGNLLLILEPTDNMLLWAWAGSVDEEFRVNSTTSGSIDIEVLKPAAAVRVRDDMRHTAARLKLGDTVEVAFQLVDDDGRAVSEAGVGIQIVTTYETNGVTDRTKIATHRTDSQGLVVVPFRATDPDREASNDSVTLDIDVVTQALEVVDQTTLGVVADDADDQYDDLITWSEEAPAASTLRLRQLVAYHEIPESGPGPVQLVRTILTDQYGDPVVGAEVRFSSDDTTGLGTAPVSGTTGRSGVATLRYRRDGSTPSSELISAETSDGNVDARPIYHYWAEPQPDRSSALGIPVLLGDVRNDVILYDAFSPKLLRYDANDRFKIRDIVVTMSAFEEALASGDYKRLSYNGYSTEPGETSSFELTNTRIFDEA